MAGLALDHRRQHRLNQPEHAVDVDRQQFVPGVGIALGDIARNVEPGIGQQDIDPSETVDSARQRRGRPPPVWSDRAARGSASPPISAATALRRSADRPTRASLAPSAAKAFAMARPIPELAPVTSATLPDRSCRMAALSSSLTMLDAFLNARSLGPHPSVRQ